MKTKIVLIAIIMATLFSCKKEKENDPVIVTSEAKSIAAFTCYAKASIIEKGSFDIIDHGFVYSVYNGNFGIENGTKISLMAEPIISNTFSTSFSFGSNYYNSSQPYYVRAYLTNKKGTVYGVSLSFKALLLKVGTVLPSFGKAGDRVTITGENFSTILTENVVKFNNTVAKVVEASATNLVVEVPSDITFNYYYDSTVRIDIVVGGQTLSANFTLLPSVTGFSPTSGTFETVISISGENLNSYGFTVMCNDIPANINFISSKLLSINIPSNITSEKFSIRLIKNGIETVLPGEFTMDPLTISSISPSKGLVGTLVTIKGTNLNPGYWANTVKIGGVLANLNSINQNELSVMVPDPLTEGLKDVEVSNGISNVVLSNAFTVVVPKVLSFSPSSGYYGTEVTFLGENLLGYLYVGFGDYGYEYILADSETFKVKVPSNITSGAIKMKVVNQNNEIIYEGNFTVLAPVITSFSPSSGTPGSEVTINGKGFDIYSTVKFGTVTTTVLSISSTQIKAVVPSNAGDGAMRISVVTGGSTTITSTDFTITK